LVDIGSGLLALVEVGESEGWVHVESGFGESFGGLKEFG